MLLADRLAVPDTVEALLFDMDGVLIDTLSMDYELVDRLVSDRFQRPGAVARSVVREHFAFDLPEFWRRITSDAGLEASDDDLAAFVAEHERCRRETVAAVHEGVVEILGDARSRGLRIAFVSNNPEADVRAMLTACALLGEGDLVVGNDRPGLAKKPAPDVYLAAAELVGVEPARCAAVEDTLVGLEAAGTAGCHVIAVATGGNRFEELAASPYPARRYTSFAASVVALGRNGVAEKSLVTPNDFVSHMIEHIAWRIGCSITLRWTNDDWQALGAEVGREIRKLPRLRSATAALGMIDDGSAEVALRDSDAGTVRLLASRQVDLSWFLASRCEQLADGAPLVSMLEGLAAAAGLDVEVTLASFEDPHHTWEGVFRAIGIALDGMVNAPPTDQLGDPAVDPAGARATDQAGARVTDQAAVRVAEPAGDAGGTADAAPSRDVPVVAVESGWQTVHSSSTGAKLVRTTAESVVTVEVDLRGSGSRCAIEVGPTVNVDGFENLLAELAAGAGFALDVTFEATRLSSSHVVTEDIGMVLGRALKHIAVHRITELGMQGAGSNIADPEELARRPIRVGVSMEGRKFCKYVPFSQDYAEFRRAFLIGHTLPGGVYSEDLDDFVDGLAGGLSASVMVHFGEAVDPLAGWPLVFRGLGQATAGMLRVNPHRRGLTPGVKATLA